MQLEPRTTIERKSTVRVREIAAHTLSVGVLGIEPLFFYCLMNYCLLFFEVSRPAHVMIVHGSRWIHAPALSAKCQPSTYGNKAKMATGGKRSASGRNVAERDKDECEREGRDGSTWWGLDEEEERAMGCGHAEWLGAEEMGNEAELELEIGIEMEMHMVDNEGVNNTSNVEEKRQGKIQTRVKDRTAGMEAGNGEAGDDNVVNDGDDGGAEAGVGKEPEREAYGADRADAKTGGRTEAGEMEEGTAAL